MNAIMIMCHKNLAQVERLIKQCRSDNTKIIVHFDKKMQISDAELENFKNQKRGGVYLTRKRLSGVLDTRSLVDITFLMIDRVKEIENEENLHFKYFILLSGQDYIIKPIWFINEELAKNYPKPFIDCTPYDKSNWIYKKFRYGKNLMVYRRWVSRNFHKTIFRRTFRVPELIARKILSVLHKTDYDYFVRQGINIYGGSAWWILPDKAINYILEERQANEKWFGRLLNTETPEETFFQTLTMRSPVKDLVEINPKDMVAQNCKTWAYFSDVDKPFNGHPYVFTENEYEKLIEKNCWFARKFDIMISEKIFDMLDEYRKNF